MKNCVFRKKRTKGKSIGSESGFGMLQTGGLPVEDTCSDYLTCFDVTTLLMARCSAVTSSPHRISPRQAEGSELSGRESGRPHACARRTHAMYQIHDRRFPCTRLFGAVEPDVRASISVSPKGVLSPFISAISTNSPVSCIKARP